MPKAPIHFVDSHVHFWDPSQFHYAWLEPPLRTRFLPSDMDSGAYVVDAMVAVQADCRPEESMAEVADEPFVVGVRRLIQDEQPGFVTSARYAAGARRAAELGLVVDLCVRWPQLPEVVRLSAACPDVTFVLDHVGKPGIAAGGWEPWASDLASLADNPRVHCKLSGLTTEADHRAWTPAQLRPYLDHALDVFGPRDCLVGSDWPVVTLATTYPGWLDTVTAALSPLTDHERALVLRENAVNVYGLDVDGQQHSGGS